MNRRSTEIIHDRVAHLGAALAVTGAVALFLAGSVRPWQIGVLHLLLVGVALLALRLPDRRLAASGPALRWAGIGLLPVAALLTGLLFLPPAVLEVVAPGVVRAFPDGRWHTLSLVPEHTVSKIALLLLAICWGLLVGVWASARRESHHGLVDAFVWGTGALVVFAFAHALTGASSVLGIVEVSQLHSTFFAPLVNPNHLGTVLLLTFPVVFGRARDALRAREEGRWVYVGVAVGSALLMVAIVSPGVWTALAGVALAWALIGRRGSLRGLLLAGATTVAAGVVLALLARSFVPRWWSGAVVPRLEQWGDLPALFREFWLAGTGGGAYVAAYPPYRSFPQFVHYTHVHSDWMEWVVETGVLGLVAGGLAVYLFSRWPETRDWRTARLLVLGLLGALLHVVVEFSLQIPAILLLVVAVLVVRYAGYGEHRPVAPGTARRWLLAVALLQTPLVLWQVRTHLVETAVEQIRAAANNPAEAGAAAQTVAWLAPWRADDDLHAAWTAQAAGDREAAIAIAHRVSQEHLHDPHALRQAAAILAREGRLADAIATLERAIARDPNDYRTWAFASRARRATDPERSLEDWAEALRHWPYGQAENGQPLREGFAMMPVGLWWLTALEDAPSHWSAWLGGLLVEVGDPQTALLAYEQAAALDADYDRFAPRARAMAGVGAVEEAEAFLRELIDETPGDTLARWVLADLLEEQERWDEAREVYLEVLRLDQRMSRAKVGAIRAAEEAAGAKAGLLMADRFAVSGLGDAQTRLETARLQLASNHPSECLRIIDTENLTDISGTREAAGDLRRECVEACTVCGGQR